MNAEETLKTIDQIISGRPNLPLSVQIWSQDDLLAKYSELPIEQVEIYHIGYHKDPVMSYQKNDLVAFMHKGQCKVFKYRYGESQFVCSAEVLAKIIFG